MSKVWTITLALLRQNRWLFLLLVAWPWAFLALMVLPEGNVSQGDLLSLLQQEYFYGTALTMVYAASLLGGELRARRVAAVLCRAVSRGQYLAALWATVLLPGIFFAISVFLSIWLAAADLGLKVAILLPVILELLVVEIWVTASGVFFSLFLPALLASLAVGATAAVLISIGGVEHWLGMWTGPGPLILSVLHVNEGRNGPNTASMGTALASTLVQAVALAVVSLRVFQRKDLPSSGE
ncbi:MAG: hypothetical protein ACP5EP_07985 [Acidobacteriaceae bacterium]